MEVCSLMVKHFLQTIKKVVSLDGIDGIIGGKFLCKTSLDKGRKSRSYSKREDCFLGGQLMVGAGVLRQFSATSFQ